MGLLDSLKKMSKRATKTAEDLADDHGDEIKKGLDKVADVVDDRTKHKHAKTIDSVADKAKGFVGGLADDDAKPAPKRPASGD